MRRQSMCTTKVTYRCWMYSLMVQNPSVFRASSTGGHSQSPPTVCQAVFPKIPLPTQWCILSITFNIVLITIQLSIPYSNTVFTTALYSISCACTVTPVLVNTFATIPHKHHAFWRLRYSTAQLLLLNSTVWHKYGHAAAGSNFSAFALIVIWLD